MNKKIKYLISQKNKKKLVCLTAYSKPLAKILDKYCDLILVGDSIATTIYGMKNTHSITMEMIIHHAKSVSTNLKNALCVVDMPINTYKNIKEAKKNAILLIKKTKCSAVKIESNKKNFNIIRSLVKIGIPVMGHIGFTPQNSKNFKVQGTNKREETNLIEEAKQIEEAGAFSVVLECIKAEVSKKITQNLYIPTIGIGSSINCDGQILVTDDMLGLSGFYPKFVKKYTKLDKVIENSVQKYKNDVVKKKFPNKKTTF